MLRHLLAATTAFALASPALAGDEPDLKVVARLTDAEMNHGEVLDTVAHLTDGIGGRLTNSPAMREAERWTQERFRAWGLANVHLEPFEFGPGWSIEAVAVRMTAPRPLPLRAIPVAWTPGTSGAVTAPIVVAPLLRERDFAAWRGKLKGRIVLISLPTGIKESSDPVHQRYSDADLARLDRFEQPQNDSHKPDRFEKRIAFSRQVDAFLAAEGALAWVSMSYRDGGLVSGEGYGYRADDRRQLPGLQLAAEDYRRLARLAKVGPVTLEIDSRVRFHDGDTRANNVIAEIPASDPRAGYVMAGAHLDSWVAADGAADNAAGSAVVMEAARLLAGLGLKPKRTIRFALWAGEEQGLLGSLAYIERHLASRPAETDPARAKSADLLWPRRWPISLKPGHQELAAYFNLDNGSGKIRGVYAEGNPAVTPIFRSWLAPFGAMGAGSVVASPTTGTDHEYMQAVGLPAFQFIQDPLDYDSRVHHSTLDSYDHLSPADLRQAAVIMASFLWNAANRAEPLPRGVVPSAPRDSDPFAYPDPREAD